MTEEWVTNMIPIITFVLTCGTGIISTAFILNNAQRSGKVTHHQHALILSLGLGITAALSFFITLVVPGSYVKLDLPLILFGAIHALVWTVATYTITRLLLKIRM